jgi:hypothetical protein
VREPLLVCWKRHTPWFTKFEFEKFFSLFYIISTQRNHIKIYIKNRIQIGVLRNWEQFQICSVLFYTPCSIINFMVFLGWTSMQGRSKAWGGGILPEIWTSMLTIHLKCNNSNKTFCDWFALSYEHFLSSGTAFLAFSKAFSQTNWM